MRNYNTVKIVAAWLIATGVIALALGLVGMQFRLLFFLDLFGPVAGYFLKFGLIVLGVWIWRRDGLAPVDTPLADEENRRAWVPVLVAGTVMVGIVGFIATNEVNRSRSEHHLLRLPPNSTWAVKPVKLWPTLVLMQQAKFAHHTSMHAGCASLVRMPTGEIVALTAGHLLGHAGGVNPSFLRGFGELDKDNLATLNIEITSWQLYFPDAEGETNADTETIKLVGLYGDATQWNEGCDQLLLRLAAGQTNYPATPLDVRLTPVSMNEKLHVAGYSVDYDGNVRQLILPAHRIPGFGFQCVLEEPADLTGFSGAPVLDQNGLLVGIVTGGSLAGLGAIGGYSRAFSGHLARELIPVLKPEVKTKGMATLSPMEAVFNISIATQGARGSNSREPRNTATMNTSI